LVAREEIDMKYQIILFVILFTVVWIMHKPFDVHSSKTWINRFHEWLEYVLVFQGVIIVNEWLKLI
jgi:hypothetical protein